MSLKGDLLDTLSRLPATGSPAGRKALLLCTRLASVGIGLEYGGETRGFFSRLLAELARRGTATLAAFLEALLGSPYAERCRPELEELRDRVRELDGDALAAELGAPAGPPRAPDAGMLAAAAVLEVLKPCYELGDGDVRGRAGEPAAELAAQVIQAVEAALAGDLEASRALTEFRQAPFQEEELVAQLRRRLEGDPARTAELARLLGENPQVLRALAETGWGDGWFLGGAAAAVIGHKAVAQIVREVMPMPEMAMSDEGEGPGEARGLESTGKAVVGDEPQAEGDGALVEEKIRLDVAAPRSARQEEPFDLAVAVAQPEAATLHVEGLPNVESGEGIVFFPDKDTVVLYRVEVTAKNCDVEPPHHTFRLRRGTSSAPLFFQLTPHRQGKQSILVTAYQEDGTSAAQTRLEIKVRVPVEAGGTAGGPTPPSGPRRTLTGAQYEQLCIALKGVFDRGTLTEFLKFRLDRELEEIAAPGNLAQVVFQVVGAADREGWIGELVGKAAAWLPERPDLQALAQQLGATSSPAP